MSTVSRPPDGFHVLGTRPIRHDGMDKVLGRAVYGADVALPGLVHGAVLRSPHAHARILGIDTSRAASAPGVLAVLTAADFSPSADPDAPSPTERLMASTRVVFRGHPVAAVAAVDRNTAEQALRLIDVSYEPLPPVLTIEEALAPDAPEVQESTGPHGNVVQHDEHEFGDVDAGFASAEFVLEREYRITRAHQGYIEPQNATAVWGQDGRLSVRTSTQGAFFVRSELANMLGVPVSHITVVPQEIGGGFGGKIDLYLEPIAAVLSRKSGHPVKLVMDRASVLEATGPAPGAIIRIKLGVAGDGLMTAATADIWLDIGAFQGESVEAAVRCVFACYRIATTRIEGYGVLTHLTRTSPYRAPGSPQVAFAMECIVDEACELLGMDPIEFRLLNGSTTGDRRADGPRYPVIGNLDVLEAARATEHYDTPIDPQAPVGRKRGRGVASGYWANGGNSSTVTLSINDDGGISLVEGSTDIGGTRTSVAMQAAEVLGITAEEVHPTVADTDGIGYTDMTGGSRTTYATGEAAIQAALKVAATMKERAAALWEIDPEQVAFADGTFSASAGNRTITFHELTQVLDETGGPVSETATVTKHGGGGGAFATHIVDVEVDEETGKVEIIRYTAVQDTGLSVHPSYVEGQMQGGAVQGIGWALTEEYLINEQGCMENASLLDYRIPTALDVPFIDTVIVEVANANHTFGVRGVGEVPITPPAPAIANAIHNATGLRLRELPMKPGRVLAAIRSARAGA